MSEPSSESSFGRTSPLWPMWRQSQKQEEELLWPDTSSRGLPEIRSLQTFVVEFTEHLASKSWMGAAQPTWSVPSCRLFSKLPKHHAVQKLSWNVKEYYVCFLGMRLSGRKVPGANGFHDIPKTHCAWILDRLKSNSNASNNPRNLLFWKEENFFAKDFLELNHNLITIFDNRYAKVTQP